MPYQVLLLMLPGRMLFE